MHLKARLEITAVCKHVLRSDKLKIVLFDHNIIFFSVKRNRAMHSYTLFTLSLFLRLKEPERRASIQLIGK